MRLRVIGACALSALTLVTGAACGSDDDSPSRSATERPATTALSDEAADAQAGLTVEDTGAEPRQPLRLRVAPGTTARTALVNKLTLKLTADGEELPAGAVPSTRLVIEQHIDRVDADGTVHYTASFTDPTALPTAGTSASVVRETQQALDEMEGLKVTVSMDGRGGAKKAQMDTSGITDETLKALVESMTSQIDNLAAPFPRVAVGPGARWTAKSSAAIAGISMNTTTHYTLRSRDGDRYELDVSQEATVPPGPVQLPNVPSSATTTVEHFDLTSTGTISGDLTLPLPRRSAMSGEGSGEFAFAAGGESGRLAQEITMEITLSPA